MTRALLAFILPLALSVSTVAAPAEMEGFSGNYLASRSAAKLNDIAAAADYSLAAMRNDPANPQITERLFQYQLDLGRITEAEALAPKVLASNSQQRMARLVTGLKAFRNRRYGEARDNFAEASYTPVGELTSALLSAWAYAGEGSLNAALKELSKLEGQDSFANYQTLHAALIADFLNNQVRAEQSYRRAYQQAGTSLRVVMAYGSYLARNNRKTDAIKVLQAYLAGGQHNALVEQQLADVKAGKVPGAFVATPMAGAGEALFSLAAALSTDQSGDQGLMYAQLALSVAQDKTISQSLIGDILTDLKNYESANDAYQQISATSPLRSYAATQVALNLQRLGKSAEAIDILKGVLAADAKSQDAWTTLGGVYRTSGNLTEATIAYGKAIDLAEADGSATWRVYFYRGISQELQKNYDKAEADYRKAMVLAPDEPQILNQLGYSFIDRGINLKEALAMVKRAVELKPNDGLIMDSLAWAYYITGDYDQAAAYQERAVDLKPGEPILAEHLGDIYWRVGRKLEAQFEWQHAVDNEPKPDDLIRIEGKLKNGLPDVPAVKPAENNSTVPSNG